MGMGNREVKILYDDGDNTRAVRGIITSEDDIFVHLHRRDSDIRINKSRIIKIEKTFRRRGYE